MSSDPQTSEHYCEDLVRRRDEERWLAAQYCAPDVRARLIALYALHQEVRHIPAAVSEPPLGEIRLQWWREALEEIVSGEPVRAHPVVEFAAETGAVTDHNRTLIDRAIDARAHLFYGEPFASTGALLEWLDQSEGYLAGARLDDAEALGEKECAALVRVETIFTLAKDAEAFPKEMVEKALLQASSQIVAAKDVLQSMPPNQSTRHLHLALVKNRMRRSPGALTPVVTRLRLFKTMLTGRF